MKLLNLLLITLICGFSFSCEDDPNFEITDESSLSETLTGIWLIKEATLDNAPRSDWEGFKLTLQFASDTSGLFLSNSEELIFIEGRLKVWPASSTWLFDETRNDVIIRSDGLEIFFSTSTESLILSFDPWFFVESECDPSQDPDCPFSDTFGFWKFELIKTQ